MANANDTDSRRTVEQIHKDLKCFGSFSGGKAFKVLHGVDPNEADDFTRCVTEFLRQSMEDGIDAGGVPPATAWVNCLLLEMIDAVGYVARQERMAGLKRVA